MTTHPAYLEAVRETSPPRQGRSAGGHRLFVATLWCLFGSLASAAADDPKDWEEVRKDRQQLIERHLKNAADGYRWFTSAVHGSKAGTPMILLRLFPELAPDIWGPPGERLARFGFFDTPETRGRPLPLGLGWVENPVAGETRKPPLYRATLTCAACHVG